MTLSKQALTGIIIGVVVLLGISFCVGMKCARISGEITNQGRFGGASQNAGMRNGNRTSPGAGTLRNGGLNGMTIGTIISKDDTGMTIELREGGSRIVFFGTTTPIRKSIEASVQDLIVGESVSVSGSQGDDGSIRAESIQVGIPLRMMATSTSR